MDPASSLTALPLLQSANSTGEWLFALLVMLVLIVVSAMFSGSEVAFFSLNIADLDEIEEAGDRNGQRVIELLRDPDRETASKRLLATILIANNFVNIAIILISTFVANSLLTGVSETLKLIINIGVVTFIIVFFGEVIPKVYATINNRAMARTMSLPLMVTSKVFAIPAGLLLRSTNFIDRRLERRQGKAVSVGELEQALELTQDDERTDEQQKILSGIVSFGSTDVKQIMTSRLDLISASLETPFAELLEIIRSSGFSRIPVCESSLDEIVGILYVKDLISHLSTDDFAWQDLIRSPFFVPEMKKIDDLLQEFRTKKIHMAIVVDEYGGTSGLITLEDIIEEIVGEIADEFDDEDLHYSKLDDLNYVFEGKTPLIDIYRILDIDGAPFEETKGESDTLAGFVIEHAGKIPLKGERIQFLHYTFTVDAADRRKVKRIKLTINPDDELLED
ncbi:MAG: gliding motility-associated protein GldE [Flavobacteriales bacterium]